MTRNLVGITVSERQRKLARSEEKGESALLCLC